MNRFLFSSLMLIVSLSQAQAAINLEEVEKNLKGPGVIGWIHGAVPGYDQFVFTIRNPDNFFEHIELPLVTEKETVKAELRKLTRHDEVKIKGKFLDNLAPVKHINLEEVTLVNKFENPVQKEPYQHSAELPKDLEGKTELVGKVHAVANEGKILVVEYKDAVVPVYVPDPTLTKGLYRNDKIRMKYVIRKNPPRPSHVSLDTKAPNPLVVTDSVVKLHNTKGEREGQLILFTKSPQIAFNVFALQDIDAEGITREWTLVNFDPKTFEAIRAKLQEAWDKHPDGVKDARNKFINLKVRVRATGTLNIIDPGQANPQVLLTGPESVTVLP